MTGPNVTLRISLYILHTIGAIVTFSIRMHQMWKRQFSRGLSMVFKLSFLPDSMVFKFFSFVLLMNVSPGNFKGAILNFKKILQKLKNEKNEITKFYLSRSQVFFSWAIFHFYLCRNYTFLRRNSTLKIEILILKWFYVIQNGL